MDTQIKEKWIDIIDYLRTEFSISDVSYRTWIKPLYADNVTDDTVTIVIDDSAVGSNCIDHIEKKYGEMIKTSISAVTEHAYNVKFVLKSQIGTNDTPKKIIKQPGDIYSSLNPRYTFDTFVIGENNSMAQAAALAVAEAPGNSYNPLFIYGGVGLGKTHLMHSIANYVLTQNPEKKVAYVTSEKFTNELIEAIRNNGSKNTATPANFRERYRSVDILLIDDIQFIIGKESTQEEFFHTFNTLYENKKQIIISSDRPPKDMLTLEDRLRSRFESGLTVDIQQPNYETRMAILRKKEEIEGLKIDDDVLNYIANNIKSNVRELEGALIKITALSKLKKKEVNVVLAEEALKDLISPDNHQTITVEYIVDIVAEQYNISSNEIYSSNRSHNISYPRQIAMYLCRKLTNYSVTDIGRMIGKRDHSTVLHGIAKIENDLKENDVLQNEIDVLNKKINPS
jgi:chromosomal replication initiator protein